MSTEAENLLEILKNSEHSPDLHSLFNNSKGWKSDSKATKETISWLGFHAESYFSPFRACFLFELGTIQSLEYFSPLHSRDGAMTLLHFFFKHPRPSSSETLLLVHERMEDLIPDAWFSQCLIYRKTPKIPSFKTTAARRLILINSSFGSRQCSPEFIKAAVKNLDLKKVQCDNVTLVNFSPKNPEELDYNEHLAKEHIDVFFELASLFPNKIEIKTATDLHNEDLSNSKYLDLNEFNFYYSDSAFENLIQSRGAQPMNFVTRNDFLYQSDLSFYHSIQIFKPKIRAASIGNNLQTFLKNASGLIEKERSLSAIRLDPRLRVVSEAFEDFAFDFVSKTLRPIMTLSDPATATAV